MTLFACVLGLVGTLGAFTLARLCRRPALAVPAYMLASLCYCVGVAAFLARYPGGQGTMLAVMAGGVVGAALAAGLGRRR